MESNKKFLFIFLIGFFVTLSIMFDVSVVFESAKNSLVQLNQLYVDNNIEFITAYFFIYILFTSLSIPFANILTLIGAAVLGFWKSLIIISFASTIGATLAFLISRYILKNSIQKKFPKQYKTINEKFLKDGKSYLFTLRVIPVFPFFMINLLMGLTSIKVSEYFWVSQVGMLAGTAVYVNAGVSLGKLESMQGILSPEIFFSLVLLGIFPWLAKLAIKRTLVS